MLPEDDSEQYNEAAQQIPNDNAAPAAQSIPFGTASSSTQERSPCLEVSTLAARSADDVIRLSQSEARGCLQIADAPRHPLFVSMMESLQESQVNVSASIFEAEGGLRPAVLPVSSQESFVVVAGSPVVRKALSHIASSCAKGTSACCQPLDGGAAVIKRFQQVAQVAVGGSSSPVARSLGATGLHAFSASRPSATAASRTRTSRGRRTA